MPERPKTKPTRVKLDFRGGGWVILLSLLLVAALLLWRVVPSIRAGRTPYSAALANDPANGFDLSTCLVPRDQLVAGMPRDTLLPLDNPRTVPADQIDALNKEFRRYLLPGDRVIGVVIAGQPRAYPLRVLAWHEICNDTLAESPIAVTYSPLCDSAVVFDRRVAGRDLHFAVSGLLYNSNLVMYDTAPAPPASRQMAPEAALSPPAPLPSPARPSSPASRWTRVAQTRLVAPLVAYLPAPQPAQEVASLWSQLQLRAIAGPAAARQVELTVLPAQVVYWADWKRQHPASTVVAPDPANFDRYRREPYSNYYGTGKPRYPVQPLPQDPALPYFTPVIAVDAANQRRVYPLPVIASHADAQGRWLTDHGNIRLQFDLREMPPNPPTVWVRLVHPDATPVRYVQSFWFAWHAMHPRDVLVTEQSCR